MKLFMRRVGQTLGFLLLFGSAVLSVAAEDIWIDVRSEQEFAGGHLDGAVNIPHTAIAEQIAGLGADKNTSIKLYCRSGGRAGLAKKTLEDLGYTNVENVGGLEDAKQMLGSE